MRCRVYLTNLPSCLLWPWTLGRAQSYLVDGGASLGQLADLGLATLVASPSRTCTSDPSLLSPPGRVRCQLQRYVVTLGRRGKAPLARLRTRLLTDTFTPPPCGMILGSSANAGHCRLLPFRQLPVPVRCLAVILCPSPRPISADSLRIAQASLDRGEVIPSKGEVEVGWFM